MILPFLMIASVFLFLILSPTKKDESKKTPEQELGRFAKYLSHVSKSSKS